MKKKAVCPVCNRGTRQSEQVRTQKVWRNVAKNDFMMVSVARCGHCYSEYEIGSHSLPKPPLGSGHLFLLIMLTLTLSLIGAFLSLTLISQGAIEWNPILAYFLSLGPIPYLLVKYLLTVVSVMVLVLVYSRSSFRGFLSGSRLFLVFQGILGFGVIYQLFVLKQAGQAIWPWLIAVMVMGSVSIFVYSMKTTPEVESTTV